MTNSASCDVDVRKHWFKTKAMGGMTPPLTAAGKNPACQLAAEVDFIVETGGVTWAI